MQRCRPSTPRREQRLRRSVILTGYLRCSPVYVMIGKGVPADEGLRNESSSTPPASWSSYILNQGLIIFFVKFEPIIILEGDLVLKSKLAAPLFFVVNPRRVATCPSIPTIYLPDACHLCWAPKPLSSSSPESRLRAQPLSCVRWEVWTNAHRRSTIIKSFWSW